MPLLNSDPGVSGCPSAGGSESQIISINPAQPRGRLHRKIYVVAGRQFMGIAVVETGRQHQTADRQAVVADTLSTNGIEGAVVAPIL